MRRKILTIILGIVFLGSLSFIGFTKGETDQETSIYKQLDLFGEALSVIQSKYVEEKPSKDLIYGAISGMLFSLDSYSQFLDPDGYKELLVETEGQFGGLGIEITIRDSLLTIVSPLEDSPAWKAGVEPGDIIVKIGDESTKEITMHQAVNKLRGKPGTEITITVLRESDRMLHELKIIRDIIKIKDIKRALILEDGVGYVKLAEFRESTANDLAKALKQLEKKGMTALILDLRNNPGGLLNSAIEVTSKFLENDKLVVFTKTRDGKQINYDAMPLKNKVLSIPMVVMINRGSASGSEIVAAGLRENKRAILLGEKSFGKGSVQTVLPLSDGSAVRVTTAKYYTPLGTSIHEKGIVPDITVVAEKIKTAEDVFQEIKNGEDVFNYKEDNQILRALDLIKGLMVLSSN